jgi:hypothetical protein
MDVIINISTPKTRSNKKEYLMPFNIICVNERKTLTRASELTSRADLKKYEQKVQNEQREEIKEENFLEATVEIASSTGILIS